MNRRVYIIAEAGVNHNGNIDIAKKMIQVAAKSGVNAVKFQTFNTKKLVCMNAEKAAYQKKNTNKDESQFEMLKKLELSYDNYRELMECCKENQIEFLSTPFDMDSIDLLEKLGMSVYKIPSGEITNLPYLRKIGQLKKKVILSSGMSNLEEVITAMNVLKENGTNDISVLHCNTQYPTPMCDVNLNIMETLRNELQIPIGYSDHTMGIEIPIAAAALGADIIEKHFTLDKNMEGPDHKASLEPNELSNMVNAIRNVELALGSYKKEPSQSEKDNISIARKSIVAKKGIKKGQVFTEENLTVKRPGKGISPMQWDQVIGSIAKRDFDEDEMIEV